MKQSKVFIRESGAPDEVNAMEEKVSDFQPFLRLLLEVVELSIMSSDCSTQFDC